MSITREAASLRDLVVTKVRDQILLGDLQPGQKIVESDLSDRLGVSRNLLRESLQQLRAEGLVVYVLHRGPSVVVVSRQDAIEICQVRALLTGQAGRDFTRAATDGQISDLQHSLDDFRNSDSSTEPNAQLQAEGQFYETLLRGCGNATVASLHALLSNRFVSIRRALFTKNGRLAEIVDDLQKFITVIRSKDADEAGRLISIHVEKIDMIAINEYAFC